MLRSTSKIFTFVFVLVLTGSVWAQKPVDPTPKSTLVDATALLDDIRILSNDDMEGRSAANPSMQKARDYVQRRFRESGILPLNPTYDQEFQIKTRGTTLKGVNFVGIIKGSKNPENYIIVTAHYDHLGIRNGAIYNGADDNASGTAALFALAKAFKKRAPLNSIIFVACDGEEEGDLGSKYFVANLPVKKESVQRRAPAYSSVRVLAPAVARKRSFAALRINPVQRAACTSYSHPEPSSKENKFDE